jgi:hypothetical protein
MQRLEHRNLQQLLFLWLASSVQLPQTTQTASVPAADGLIDILARPLRPAQAHDSWATTLSCTIIKF